MNRERAVLMSRKVKTWTTTTRQKQQRLEKANISCLKKKDMQLKDEVPILM